MRAKGFVFLALLGSLASGCGSDTKTDSASEGSSSPAPTSAILVTSGYLLGTWTTLCTLDPKRHDIYIQDYLTYDDEGNVDRSTTSYLDSRCTAELFQENLHSTFAFTRAGAYTEDRKSVAYLPYSSAAVSMFTTYSGFCGDKDWHVNEERTFQDVKVCGVDPAVKLSLTARSDQGMSELEVRECEPRNPRACTSLRYLRAK
jgi:hypothetical protein